MKSQSDRATAENLYVEEGKTLDEIAGLTAVTKGTLANWSREGLWTQKRRERRLASPHPELNVLKQQLALQIKQIPDDKLADAAAIDALHKLSVIVEKMESRLEPEAGPLLEAMLRFAQFVAARADDAACATVREWLEKFLDEERRKNG